MDYQNQVLEQLKAQTALLTTLCQQMQRLEWLVAPDGPNYTHPLAAFAGFDWASIGAEVTGRDRQGVSRVEWFGKAFTRRSGDGKFGQAVWFSRYTGEEGGEKKYARLVTFKDYSEAEPVARGVGQAAGGE